ncbi:MAG: hypothetical protein A2X27_05145 [Chloroflexi bacterium GWD2_49_16]|nr:MAG: hypothetical protein A2X27_05145 [Chloroflexi bacterium GWD2_49_16]
MLALIAAYNQWQNPTAWIYLALHGTYGIHWVLKSLIYPDLAWEQETSIWFGIVSWIALALYWIPGWLLMSLAAHAPAGTLAYAYQFIFLGFSSTLPATFKNM